jgi:hypothetical protein
MSIVTLGAIIDLSFTLPFLNPFAMCAKSPILEGIVMTLGADKVCLVKFHKLTRKQS